MLSQGKTLTLTTTLLLVLIFSLTTLGATHVVSKDGAQFSSVQMAIDAAEPGDTVVVHEGVYRENLSVDKDLTLKGEGASKVKVDGQKEGQPVLYVGPSFVEVTVKDLTLQGAEGDSCKDEEKWLCPTGVTTVGDSEIKVKGVTISGNEFGIELRDSAWATIKNDEIKENSYGIWLEGSARATVEDSEITGNELYAIALAHSAQAIVYNSEITGNENTGMDLWHSAQAIVYNSEIKDNGTGLGLGALAQVTLENSEIKENKVGIGLVGSARATIQNNSFRKNEVGIEICYPESFEGSLEGIGNRIIDNETDFKGVTEPTREELISEPKKPTPLNNRVQP